MNFWKSTVIVGKIFHIEPSGGARGKIRESPKSSDFVLRASAQNLMAIHPKPIEIFHSEVNW